MSDFDSLHPRANPGKPGAFSERQQAPPQVSLDEHAARDREYLHAEVAQIRLAVNAIVAAGRETFFDDPAELSFLAACMTIVRFDDLATHRLSDDAKSASADVPWVEYLRHAKPSLARLPFVAKAARVDNDF